ncbi:MAG: hypothetical protein NVS3B21_13630 [Acidimicrobiales bacterium]
MLAAYTVPSAPIAGPGTTAPSSWRRQRTAADCGPITVDDTAEAWRESWSAAGHAEAGGTDPLSVVGVTPEWRRRAPGAHAHSKRTQKEMPMRKTTGGDTTKPTT